MQIKVGQIRRHKESLFDFKYIITGFYHNVYGDWWASIRDDGQVENCRAEEYEKDELIHEYSTWQEAVNSEEFK